jgi:hypothetical protein
MSAHSKVAVHNSWHIYSAYDIITYTFLLTLGVRQIASSCGDLLILGNSCRPHLSLFRYQSLHLLLAKYVVWSRAPYTTRAFSRSVSLNYGRYESNHSIRSLRDWEAACVDVCLPWLPRYKCRETCCSPNRGGLYLTTIDL